MTTARTPKKFYAILVQPPEWTFDQAYLDGPWRTLKEATRYVTAGEKVVKVEVVKPPKRKRA